MVYRESVNLIGSFTVFYLFSTHAKHEQILNYNEARVHTHVLNLTNKEA